MEFLHGMIILKRRNSNRNDVKRTLGFWSDAVTSSKFFILQWCGLVRRYSGNHQNGRSPRGYGSKRYSDFQLILNQISGVYKAKEEATAQYLQSVWALLNKFEEQKISMCIVQILHRSNSEDIFLTKLAPASVEYVSLDVHMDTLTVPSIREPIQSFSI